MKIFFIVVPLILLVWVVVSIISVRNIEKPKYELLSRNSTYEIRAYQSYLIAETTVTGPYREALSKGFRNIADYIFGNNTASEKISMTAPVREETHKNNSTSEKIAMTVPVMNQGDDIRRKISFVMPSKYTLETIPKPNTDLVSLREIPSKKMAVLRYSWYTNDRRVKNKIEKLRTQLQKDNIEAIGEFSSALYNPPFSMPLVLRNEILVEIK